eukprot:Rhum_TRINITY_DN19424_c0_g1::Rhum_TRINITY_DN19424_c0_g1_i1::g.170021::m.170021
MGCHRQVASLLFVLHSVVLTSADDTSVNKPDAPGQKPCSGGVVIGCAQCTEEERRSVPACAGGAAMRAASCVDGRYVYRDCPQSSYEEGRQAAPPSQRSFALFQIACIVTVSVCGLLMRNRKRLLVQQQQERYCRLIERS